MKTIASLMRKCCVSPMHTTFTSDVSKTKWVRGGSFGWFPEIVFDFKLRNFTFSVSSQSLTPTLKDFRANHSSQYFSCCETAPKRKVWWECLGWGGTRHETQFTLDFLRAHLQLINTTWKSRRIQSEFHLASFLTDLVEKEVFHNYVRN